MCLCLLALSPLSGRRTWVTNSPSPRVSLKEDGERDRFKLLLLFQCTQTDLSANPWVHVHWVFPPAVSSDWEHSTDALPLTQIQDIDVDPRLSPHSLSQALFGIIAAYLHGPFPKPPLWQTELSPFCLFMPFHDLIHFDLFSYFVWMQRFFHRFEVGLQLMVTWAALCGQNESLCNDGGVYSKGQPIKLFRGPIIRNQGDFFRNAGLWEV